MAQYDAKKKVIITGVTGQDGSYMADFLLENTLHDVYGMVRRSAKPDYGNLASALSNPRFKLVTGDLSDANSIETLVREIEPDYFLNFAAQSFVAASWQVPEQTFDVTATGVLRILEAIRKHAPKCRFYSAGSSEEMGDVQYSPQNIEHPIRPRSPYGAAKAAARHITKVYRESYGLYAVHGILYNHESERRGEEFVTRKITKGVARIKNEIENHLRIKPIELGNIYSRRDWSHAEDFVEGVWLMLNQDKPKEYILSSNETHTIKEFIEKAFAHAKLFEFNYGPTWIGDGLNEKFGFFVKGIGFNEPEKGVQDHFLPLVTINPNFYRPAEVDLLLGDSTPARKELGWEPKIPFDKLVERMVKWDIDEYRAKAPRTQAQ
jgi:GDPmannose 4,6-dehydratase